MTIITTNEHIQECHQFTRDLLLEVKGVIPEELFWIVIEKISTVIDVFEKEYTIADWKRESIKVINSAKLYNECVREYEQHFDVKKVEETSIVTSKEGGCKLVKRLVDFHSEEAAREYINNRIGKVVFDPELNSNVSVVDCVIVRNQK